MKKNLILSTCFFSLLQCAIGVAASPSPLCDEIDVASEGVFNSSSVDPKDLKFYGEKSTWKTRFDSILDEKSPTNDEDSKRFLEATWNPSPEGGVFLKCFYIYATDSSDSGRVKTEHKSFLIHYARSALKVKYGIHY